MVQYRYRTVRYCMVLYSTVQYRTGTVPYRNMVNNSTLSVYCKHLLGRHPGFFRTSFGRHEITPAAYIGFPTVTTVTLALGIHRHDYVGYDRVR